MQELGFLPGGNSSRAKDVNDSGEVVGTATSASGEHAFIWTRQGGIADLNNPASAALGFVFIEAHAINARGQIIVMGRSAHDSMMATAIRFAPQLHLQASCLLPFCHPDFFVSHLRIS